MALHKLLFFDLLTRYGCRGERDSAVSTADIDVISSLTAGKKQYRTPPALSRHYPEKIACVRIACGKNDIDVH